MAKTVKGHASTTQKPRRFGWTCYFQPTKRLRQYLMLEAISRAHGHQLTQRQISDVSGISPAVVNQYLSEFQDARLIERASLNRRDFSYALTPQGERQKREMMVEYIRETFQLFSAGKNELAQILRGYERAYDIGSLVFYTAGEVTELLLHPLQETSIKLLAIADDNPAKQGTELFGYPIIPREEIEALRPDAVMITTFRYRRAIHERIKHLEDQGIRVIGF